MRIRSLAPLLASIALTLVFAAAPAHAADTTPPTAPGTPVASDLTENSVTLTWAPSTDDTGVANYEVWRAYTDIVQRVGTPAGTTITVTGLPRGSVSRFYIVAIDTSGNRSQSSPLITVTTLPGDLEPPGPVFGLTVSEITDTSVRASWQGVVWGDVASFRVYLAPASGGGFVLVATVPATTRTLVITGLSPATQYRLGVTARDAVGNESGIIPITFTTTGTPAPGCAVNYRVTSQWAGGFVAEVRIINTGDTPINGWSLSWLFANGQRITNLWGGIFTQNGGNVTVTNMPYNATIPAGGGAQSFGFIGTWAGVNNVPSPFTLNGRICVAAQN